MKIGTFIKTTDGNFEGRMETLSISADLKFISVEEKTSDNAPDFRIVSGLTEIEIGAGWHKMSKSKDKPYISAKIDDPSFAYPVWAALTLKDEGEYTLYWSRPTAKANPDTASHGETL